MVDLVKLRKKANEKKAAEVQPVETPRAVEPEPPAPAKRAHAKRVEKLSAPAPKPEEKKKVVAATEPESKAADEPKPKASEEKPKVPEARTAAEEHSLSKLDQFKKTAGRLALQQKAESAAFDAAAAEIEQLELLTFLLSGEHYAVAIEKIVEIVTPRPVTKVPNADDWILGIISLRGTIVTILDLRQRLGHPTQMSLGLDARIIVVENSGETTGFLVDKVARVVRIDPSILESHPVVATTEQSEYIRGVFQQPQGLAIVLDLERLIRI